MFETALQFLGLRRETAAAVFKTARAVFETARATFKTARAVFKTALQFLDETFKKHVFLILLILEAGCSF